MKWNDDTYRGLMMGIIIGVFITVLGITIAASIHAIAH